MPRALLNAFLSMAGMAVALSSSLTELQNNQLSPRGSPGSFPSISPSFATRKSTPLAVQQNFTVDELLNKGIQALGGRQALSALKGISFSAYLYRTQSLEESFTPDFPDTAIATAGTETISYDFSGNLSDVVQRIDRGYMISEYWTFGRTQLEPNNVSIIVRGGANGYACYTKGNELIFAGPNVAGGYTDAAYSNILVRDATRLSPKLLLMMQADKASTEFSTIAVRGISYPALTDRRTNITVIFDPDTYLPYLIRSYEDHQIFGRSTNDYVVYNYTTAAGIQVPQRIKTVYNEDYLLLDSIFGSVEVNPSFPTGFFSGLPAAEINQTVNGLPPTPPTPSDEYGEAEIFESSQSLLWSGGYTGTLANLTVTQPISELPNLHMLLFKDSPFYVAYLAVFDDAVMITDAPAHQSKLTIQYVQETLGRNVTHLLVTHHHHDHNYGAADFANIGATLVVPQDFTFYWQNIPGVKFVTSNETHPFMYKDSTMQVRAVWHQQKNTHSADWMYFAWTLACPGPNSPLGITEADAWSPGFVDYQFNQFDAVNYLALARGDHVAKNNLVLPIHGTPSNATDLYAMTGYSYPDYKTTDFLPGGAWC